VRLLEMCLRSWAYEIDVASDLTAGPVGTWRAGGRATNACLRFLLLISI
jgi:hypothetical protein